MIKFIEEINAWSGLIPKYPQKGSVGIYNNTLIHKLNIVKQGNAIRLFFILVEATDDYSVVKQPRERWSYALGVKHDSGNIARLLANIMDAGLVTYYGNEIIVNPFVVLPRVSNPKIKSAIQEWWSSSVDFQ